MLMKKQVFTIMSITATSLLIGTLFNVWIAGGGRDKEDRYEDLWKAITEMQTKIDSLNASQGELLEQVQTLELNQTQLLERIETLEEAIKPNVTLQDFIYDRFDAGLGNWTYWGDAGYNLLWAYPGAVKIIGDGYIVYAGMQKAVDLSGWNGSEPLVLSFNWRATSDTSISTVTNARLRIEDLDTHMVLYQEMLVAGGVSDTDWQSYSNDISPYLSGYNRVVIVLWLGDGWLENHHQENWYDNVRLTNDPPS